MGVDCKLITDKGSVVLDRWYVFSDQFDNETIYTYEEVQVKMKQLINDLPDRIKDPEDRKYHVHWLQMAIENTGTKNVFVVDSGSMEPYNAVVWELTKLTKKP